MAEGWSALGAFAGNALMSAFQNNMAQNNAMAGLGLSEAAQKRLMNHQAKVNWNYYIKDLQNKYVYGRQGLEAANYNPMLALGGISGNNSWTSPQSVNDLGLSENAIAGFSNATQQQLANQQGRLNEAQIENLGTQNDLNNATAGLRETEARFNELKTLEQEIINTNLPDSIKSQIRERIANAKLMETEEKLAGFNAVSRRTEANASMMNANSQRKYVKQQVDLMEKQGELTKQQAEQIRRTLPYVGAGEVSKIFRDLTVGAIGLITGGSAAALGIKSITKAPVGFR